MTRREQTPATDRLAARIVALERAVKNMSQPQLAHSAIEGGAIAVINPNGETVATIGLIPEADGTYRPDAAGGIFPMGGPKPPRPSAPIVTPGIQSLTVRWDGTYENGEVPADFMRMEVHLLDATGTYVQDDPISLRATISNPRGGEVVISPLAITTRFVVLVGRSASGVPSEPSVEVSATPLSVVSDAEVAQIKADLEANEAALAENKTQLTQLNTDLGVLRTDLGTLDTELDANTVRLNQLNTDLTALNAELDANTVELQKVSTTANGKGKVWFTPDAPVASSEFDIWFETDMDNRPYKRENGAWVLTGFGNLAVGNLDAAKISFGTMHGDRIAVNTLNADRITANTIHGDKITANTINGDRIVANTVHGDRVIANTIYGDRIIANTVSGDRIIANTLQGDRVVANTVNGDRIIGNTLHGDKIIGNTITGNKILANEIVGVHIRAREIAADHIRTGAIYAEHVDAFAVTGKVIRTSTGAAKVLIHSNDINQIRFETQFAGGAQDTSPHIRSGSYYPNYNVTNIVYGYESNMQTALVMNSGSMYHNPPRESSLVLFGAAEDNSQQMFAHLQTDRFEQHVVRAEIHHDHFSHQGAFIQGFRLGPKGWLGSHTVGIVHTGDQGNAHYDVRGGNGSHYLSWYNGSGLWVGNGFQGRGRLVAGEVNYTSLNNASSRLVKLGITPLTGGALDKVKQMVPVSFTYDPAKLPGVDNKTRFSLVAEDLQLLVPEVIETSKESIADPLAGGGIRYEDRIGINTHSLLAYLVQAVKELEAIVRPPV